MLALTLNLSDKHIFKVEVNNNKFEYFNCYPQGKLTRQGLPPLTEDITK